MVSVKQAPRHFYVELVISFALYYAAQIYGHRWAAAAPYFRDIALALPVIPAFLILFTFYRFYTRMDEMYRRSLLENAAFAAVFCGFVTLTWPTLTGLGLPRLGLIWSWVFLWIGYSAIALFKFFRLAAAAAGWGRVIFKTLALIGVIGLFIWVYAIAAPVLGWRHGPIFLLDLASAIAFILWGWAIFVRTAK